MFIISYGAGDERGGLRCSLTERSVPSDLVISKDGRSFYVGCDFDRTDDELFSSGWEDDPRVLNEGCSALYIVRFDEDGCVFAADTTGRELLFYYHDGRRLVLSDSFWGILKVVQPGYDDMDWPVVSQMIAAGGGVPCDHTTPVRGLRWLAPNTICRFDARAGTLSCEVFAEVRRTGEIKSMDEAVESFDSAMRDMARLLAERHAGLTFGLGLSGGLDSRTALHYLLQEGVSPVCFNTCVSRPHKVLLATSVRNERALASSAGVSCTEVEWDPATIASKNAAMLRECPLGPCGHFTNAYKYEARGCPDFDILVTAGQAIGPMLVGVSADEGSDELSEDDVCASLFHLCTGDPLPFAFTEWLVRGKARSLGLLGDAPDEGPGGRTWAGICGKPTYDAIASQVGEFVGRRFERGWRPADITLDFRTSCLGAIGRNGAYESRLGSAKSYTIYTPFLVRQGLTWDIPLVEGRRVLKELIARKAPELSGVGEETYGSIGRTGRVGADLGKLDFLLRGSGIMAHEWHARNRSIREAFLADARSPNAWFYEAFPAARDYEAVWGMSPSRMNSVWDLKRLVDCIEDKAYLSF